MKKLVTACVVVMSVTTSGSADSPVAPEQEVAYAQCLMKAFEHDLEKDFERTAYMNACMRVAGYNKKSGPIDWGSEYLPAPDKPAGRVCIPDGPAQVKDGYTIQKCKD